MRSFLDTDISYSNKTELVYGNLNDEYIASDLVIRGFDEYLIKLLNDKGYKHVLFCSAVRMMYTLDPVSARFFFNSNQDVPKPITRTIDFDGVKQDSVPQTVVKRDSAKPQSGGLEILKAARRGRSGRQSNGTETAEAKQQEPPQIIYRRGHSAESAINRSQIRHWMKDPDSHMALVFYNMYAENTNAMHGLADEIMSIWQSDGGAVNNICLFLYPETDHNSCAIMDSIPPNVRARFINIENGGRVLNPETCFQVGYPKSDEIKNLFRRLRIVGTEMNKRLVYDYTQEQELAEAVYYCSGSSGATPDTMREIRARLEGYINRGSMDTELTVQDIYSLWEIPYRPMDDELEAFHQPGWEKVYQCMKELHDKEEYRKINEERYDTESAPQESYYYLNESKYVIERVAKSVQKTNTKKVHVPNFVLLGNPGTGKTTIARLIGRYLHSLGLLSNGRTNEVTKAQLTNSYVAGIPRATREQIEKAQGGVLFIDEAHQIGRQDGGANNQGTGYDVISTLNNALTSPEYQFCLVLAGYEKDMDAVFELDSGFARRIDYTIKIDDYKPELLTDILMSKIRERNRIMEDSLITADESGTTPLYNMVKYLYDRRNRHTFGNAGVMESIADAVCSRTTGSISQQDFTRDGGIDLSKVQRGLYIQDDWFVSERDKDSTDKIFADLNNEFVGMDNVARYLEDMGLEIEEKKACGIDVSKIELSPLLLVGAPGTGKTTVARYLSRLLMQYGVLGTAEPIILDATDLGSSIVGASAETADKYIEKAQAEKALLFIDEAHQLCDENMNGKGAINPFLAAMTDKEKPFLPVFAVYQDRKEEFLALDPGLKRRFEAGNGIIYLNEYSADQLYEILVRNIERRQFNANEETRRYLRGVLKYACEAGLTRNKNAAYVNELLYDMDTLRRRRLKENKIDFSSDEAREYVLEDIPAELKNKLPLDSEAELRQQEIERLSHVMEEMENSRVGAEELKSVIREKYQRVLYNLKYPNKYMPVYPGHYVFVGNPGVGKTTGARFLAKYLYELHLISDDYLKELSAGDFVSNHVGETASKTANMLESCRNHINLVDEAYSMASKSEGWSNSHNAEAITEIIRTLDDEGFRRTTCMIFAGYVQEMQVLLESNSGFKSRVRQISFPDMSVEECVQILEAMLQDKKWKLAADTREQVIVYVTEMKQQTGFSNGRTMRSIAEYLVNQALCRVLRNDYASDDERLEQILPEDIGSKEDLWTYIRW